MSKFIMITLVVIFSCLGSLNTFGAEKSKGKSRFEKLELFNKVLFLIESQYYREVDAERLIEGAIKGMMSTLDPHSSYLDREVFPKLQEDTQGEFGGLGIEVSQKDGVIIVTTPIDDTPAAKAGIKPGDKIVEINHDSVLGISLEEAVDKMRGKAGSKITIGVMRDGEDSIKRMELTRQLIKVSPVKFQPVYDNYGYVRLTQFQKNSASEIIKAIKKLQNDLKKDGGLKGILLDLRNNPGGLLDEAVNVSSIFLKDGIVVSTEGRDPKNKEIRYVLKTGFKVPELPLVVLINGASASASEIVAGALQDAKRALVVGTQSFGKGSVQSIAKIDEEQGVKLTIAQYMTPLGRKIQAVGVKPDIEIGEFEGKWVEDNKKEYNFVREKDLKNHLVATVETPEEKKAREEKERNERLARIESMKKSKKSKDKNEDKKSKKYSPEEDYQVKQGVLILKARALLNSPRKG